MSEDTNVPGDKAETPTPILPPTMESINARVVAMDTNVHGDPNADVPGPRLTMVTLLLDNGHILSGDSLFTGAGRYEPMKGAQAAFERALQRLYELEVYLWTERKWRAAGCPSVIPPPHEDAPKIIVPGSTPLTLVKP